jgi:hypothetical protein
MGMGVSCLFFPDSDMVGSFVLLLTQVRNFAY